jgi:hypothetical protein
MRHRISSLTAHCFLHIWLPFTPVDAEIPDSRLGLSWPLVLPQPFSWRCDRGFNIEAKVRMPDSP